MVGTFYSDMCTECFLGPLSRVRPPTSSCMQMANELVRNREEWRSLTIQPHRRQPPGEWRTGEKKKERKKKILKQFPLFFAKKIYKRACNRNGKDAPNIPIGITSLVYKISTQFFVVGFPGLAMSNMLSTSNISRERRELPWQPNLYKNKQKVHWFHFCAKIEDFFTRTVRFSGLANSNMLSEILREPRELL